MSSDKDLTTNNSVAFTKTVITANSSDYTFLASWLFLIGSLIFLVNGFLELTEGISIHALLHLVASLLFTIGSILFIPTDKN